MTACWWRYKPTGQGDYEEVEGLYDVIHCANR